MESLDFQIMIGLFSLFYTVVEITAIFAAISAIRHTRTPQGAIAWAISLVTFPLVTLPLFWIFGRSKFHGYIDAMRSGEERFKELIGDKRPVFTASANNPDNQSKVPHRTFETLSETPFLGGNELKLLINGKATFDAIFKAIAKAERYLLVQFFIVHDDDLGQRLKNLLIAKAKEGIRIHFLYDEVGCHATSAAYWQEMRDEGIQAQPFHTTRGRGNRFQLNFRNHRKIVVIDGYTAFVGGHNVGNEYLGITDRFTDWRDTHLHITGPAVVGIRTSFAKDWYWATREVYELDTSIPMPAGDAEVMAFTSGPADELESCSLMFIRAINTAQKRFWIASPYFVPDSPVRKALQLAAMRGVDVRIMLPRNPDHLLVYLAGFACLNELKLHGIRIYRYNEGFLHQKAFLADDQLAGVGTANLDNRSFRLNFEITMLVDNQPFCTEIERMFLDDFANCIETDINEFNRKNVVYQTGIQLARLLSPIL